MEKGALSETEAVMAVVRAEHEAFWMRDREAHANCHLHAPDTWFWSYWPHGGVAVRRGWDDIRERTAQAMAGFDAPSPSYAFEITWEDVAVRVNGDTAWVTGNLRYPNTGGPFSDQRGPGGLTHQLRILEKHGGAWKIVLFSVLVPFDRSDGAMLRLDPAGRIIWKSEGAQEAIDNDLDLTVRAGCLRIRDRSADQKLQAAIRWAGGSDGRLMALRGSIPIVVDAGEGLPTKLWWLVADSGMILFLFGNRQLSQDRLAIAGSIFGLSPAQLRLAARIIAGASLVEVAHSTRVSVNTVRTQLKRMFEKVGVHSQPALVRVLLSVAAPR